MFRAIWLISAVFAFLAAMQLGVWGIPVAFGGALFGMVLGYFLFPQVGVVLTKELEDRRAARPWTWWFF